MTKNKSMDIQLLPKIIEHCDEIAADVKATVNYETFADHHVYPRASSQSLAQIGELIKRLSDEVTQNPEYDFKDWKNAARFRDKIAHGYGSLR
jgi:uncharacterized protein with HEPN domain